MSFLLRCPFCGDRSVYEFRFGGEVKQRPMPGAPDEEWHAYVYVKDNLAGEQTEWWFHRVGCRQWLKAIRNTLNNEVISTRFPCEES
ncbi:MAG: sarcosine oxidase subunit delta [Burkholderiales bacterium]